MSAEARVVELRARIELAHGSATLLLAVGEIVVSEKRRMPSAVAKELTHAAERGIKALSPAVQRDMAKQLGIPVRESRMSGELARKLAKWAGTTAAYDLGLWRGTLHLNTPLVGEESLKHMLESALQEVLHQKTGGARVARTDPQFLDKVLPTAAALLRDTLQAMPFPPEMLGSMALIGMQMALFALLEGPVAPSTDGPFLVVGAAEEPAEQRAVIEVKVGAVPFLPGRAEAVGHVVPQLDRWMTASGVAQGALVLIGLGPSGEVGPWHERVKTPTGREVLILRLL
jgi:hypothetical protein